MGVITWGEWKWFLNFAINAIDAHIAGMPRSPFETSLKVDLFISILLVLVVFKYSHSALIVNTYNIELVQCIDKAPSPLSECFHIHMEQCST